ncbi:LOW QUALITY PROTEIN: piRNA biogenesis protein EXD1 [Nannospalax galili]|uniref:LOW QUALITY PROTEIN: piRNA biogenesis protein EXD1 n=1 Tax=Nannospalax galili TaxID=1026970 RepID=UPI0004ED0C13|nr:LOW QUALITY PROTEIN: piRNA biogenesis protein EXD1 [Nannospalax galili]
MDPSSDYYFLNQILWKRVKLTLVSGAFEGVLQHVDPNKIVVLKKVKNMETGRNVPGVKMFFGHEILNVELLDEVEQTALEEKASSVSLNTERARMDKMKDEDLNVCEPASPAPEVTTNSLLIDLKYSPLEDEEVTYTVIDQFQHKFGAAMFHIKKQSVLSVAAEGANVCRHGKLCWLQVATNSRVYLFDIFLLGSRAFNNGLQMILEDKRILKVIHDCRWLSDCLLHQYRIMLNNVFDTQVADVLQFSMETGGFLPNCISTLQESLIRHLKVAPKYLTFLEERQKLTQENPEVWMTRPLSPSLLKILALETTYLLPLRLVVLDEMMSDLTTLVDGYLNTYREGSADRLASTEPMCMELPEELLQLKDFQKQRRERAAKEYRMNARGLLIRTVLHPKKSVTGIMAREEKVKGFLLCRNSEVDQAPHFICHESHKDVIFLDKESKQMTAKSQNPSPIKEGEASKDSRNKVIFGESEGPEGKRVTRKEHPGSPKHELQSCFSLKEEIEQLLTIENEEDLMCANRDASVSPLPQETTVVPSDTFYLPKKAMISTLPPCPALENTESWVNPSLNLF